MKEEVTTAMQKARGELEKFQKQSSSLQGQVRDLFRELAGPIAGVGIGAGISLFIKGSLEAASALEALDNRAKLVYGNAFPRVEQEAQKMGAALGRSSSDVLGFITDFTATFGRMHLPTGEITVMSEKMAQLSVDFGSFFNIADDEAFRMVQGGILGMGRELKRYGVDVSEAALAEFAHKKGIEDKVSAMSTEQQMLLRTNMILEQTTKIQGDAIRNAGSFSNRTKDMNAQWKDFQETLGKPALGIVAEALWTITTTMHGLGTAIQEVTGDWLRFGVAMANALGANIIDDSQRQKTSHMTREGMNVNVEHVSMQNIGSLLSEINRRKGVREAGEKTADEALRQQYASLPGGGGGGGGGKNAEATQALQDAKNLLSDIDKIEKDIVDHIGKQADANKKVKEGLREDLKLKKDMGVATKEELHDLDTLNRRLGDGRDRINDLKGAWEKQLNVVEQAKNKVQELNDLILQGGRDLEEALGKIDRDKERKGKEISRDVGRSIEDKAAEMIRELRGLDDKMARGEGNSEADLQKRKELEAALQTLTPEQRAAGKQIGGLNPFEEIQRQEKMKLTDLTTDVEQRKLDVVLEANKKQEEAVNKLTQASIELSAAQGGLKAIQHDLVEAMGGYEQKMTTSYALTEDATRRHVAGQVAELQKETDAVNALANAYSRVQSLQSDRTASQKASNILGNPAQQLARDIQLQSQGSSR